ncbi:hypothetical protein QJQ45_030217 [Haematococcus lacustris]|nr:hypothetical protein QJQ45_030217 [Haematococcus lacustris]
MSFYRGTASHPWHDLNPGNEAPELCNVVIEIPRGSKVKYELDKDTGLCFVDRILYSSVVYPHNYGFIPKTLCEDGDAIDVLVLMQEAVVPLCFLRARPIGVMQMLDQGERDDKVIAVHADDPEFKGFSDISQLPPHRLAEIKRFFEDYKKNEHKEVIVDEFLGADEAKRAIRDSLTSAPDCPSAPQATDLEPHAMGPLDSFAAPATEPLTAEARPQSNAATARLNAHRVMAKKGSGKRKKDPGKKQKGACPQPTVSSVCYALCTNPSLLLVPSQRLVPFKASNDRSVGMAGPRADVRCRPRLMCPRTACVPALCLGLSKWQLRLVMQVIKVPEGAVLRGCKKTMRKLREHLRLRAEIHSQLRFIASLFVLRIFLTCLVGYPTPGFPSAPQPPAVQPPQPPDAPRLPPLPPRAPAQPTPAQPASMECDTDSDSKLDCDSEPEPQSDSVSRSEPEPVRRPPQRRCSARLAALAPAAPTGPPLPLDCEDPLMLRQLKDFCKFLANPNFKTVYNQLQRRLVRKGQHRHPMLMPAFEDPSNQALLAKLPRGAGQRRGRVVLVDEHRTSRVSSAVNGKQPCEEELNKLSATRPAGWKPPAGQVEPRLVRPAWSQERDQPVRGLMWCPVVAPRKPPQAPRSSQAATQPAASEPGPSTPPPAKRSKPAAEPTQPTKGKGKAAKVKPAPQPGRWLDRDCNAALNMQRIGESKWRPLELCYWPDQGALPAKGKEYPGLGYKRLRDQPPKAQQQQQQPAEAHIMSGDDSGFQEPGFFPELPTLLAMQDALSVNIEPVKSDPSNKRLSLGSLVGKGIVSGMKGFWETGSHKAGPIKAKGQPRGHLAQSQDRGLLFKVPAAETAASCAADSACSEQSTTSKPKTPSSGMKKLIGAVRRSMTAKSPKAAAGASPTHGMQDDQCQFSWVHGMTGRDTSGSMDQSQLSVPHDSAEHPQALGQATNMTRSGSIAFSAATSCVSSFGGAEFDATHPQNLSISIPAPENTTTPRHSECLSLLQPSAPDCTTAILPEHFQPEQETVHHRLNSPGPSLCPANCEAAADATHDSDDLGSAGQCACMSPSQGTPARVPESAMDVDSPVIPPTVMQPAPLALQFASPVLQAADDETSLLVSPDPPRVRSPDLASFPLTFADKLDDVQPVVDSCPCAAPTDPAPLASYSVVAGTDCPADTTANPVVESADLLADAVQCHQPDADCMLDAKPAAPILDTGACLEENTTAAAAACCVVPAAAGAMAESNAGICIASAAATAAVAESSPPPSSPPAASLTDSMPAALESVLPGSPVSAEPTLAEPEHSAAASSSTASAPHEANEPQEASAASAAPVRDGDLCSSDVDALAGSQPDNMDVECSQGSTQPTEASEPAPSSIEVFDTSSLAPAEVPNAVPPAQSEPALVQPEQSVPAAAELEAGRDATVDAVVACPEPPLSASEDNLRCLTVEPPAAPLCIPTPCDELISAGEQPPPEQHAQPVELASVHDVPAMPEMPAAEPELVFLAADLPTAPASPLKTAVSELHAAPAREALVCSPSIPAPPLSSAESAVTAAVAAPEPACVELITYELASPSTVDTVLTDTSMQDLSVEVVHEQPQSAAPSQAELPTTQLPPPSPPSDMLEVVPEPLASLPISAPTPQEPPFSLATEMLAALMLGEEQPAPTQAAASTSQATNLEHQPVGPLGSYAAPATEPLTAEARRQSNAAALGLLDMEMEMDIDMESTDLTFVPGCNDMFRDLQEPTSTTEDGSMPLPLQSVQSPTAKSSPVPRVPIMSMRESIPLFVRESFLVSDSVSLERLSLNSVEPFGRHTSGCNNTSAVTTSARPASLMASVMVLDTLQEDESFVQELPPKPAAALHTSHSGQLPGPLKAGTRAARVASIEDDQLGDLPNDLPDPVHPGIDNTPTVPAEPSTAVVMDTTEPAPGPAAPGAAPGKQGAAVRGRVPGPNVGSMPAKQRPGLAFKLPAAGNATLTGSGTPLMKLGSTDPGATPLMAGTKASARTPNALLSVKKTMAGPTLTAPSPATVPRPMQQAQQPGTANPLSKTPYVSSRVPAAPACPNTPPPQQAPCTLAGPAATAANSTEGTMDISPVAGLGRVDLSAHSPAGYQIAVAPGMPASWNTPLAQMQALPMDFALHAPLVDASPFDEGLNTEYITHEAKRLMDNLADSQVNDVKRVLHPPTPGAVADFSFATGFGSAATTTTSPPLRGLRPDMCSPSVPASPGFPGSRQPTPSAMDTPTTDLLGLSMSGSLTKNAGMAAVPAAAGSSCTGSSLLEMQNSAMLNMLVAAQQQEKELRAANQALREQLQILDFGGMLAESSEEDMERQARQAAEEQLQVAHTQMAVLQDSVRTMQASNTELQQQLAASQEQSTSLAAQLASTRDEVAVARAQHASALAQVEPLQAQLRSVMLERDNLKNSCVELVGKVSAAEKDTARLRQARNEAQSSLKQSTDQLVAEQLNRRQQEVDMARQAAEKISLQTSLSKLTQEREMMRKEVSELQTTLASCQKQHVADVTKLKQENAELMKMAEELMGALEKERSKRK